MSVVRVTPGADATHSGSVSSKLRCSRLAFIPSTMDVRFAQCARTVLGIANFLAEPIIYGNSTGEHWDPWTPPATPRDKFAKLWEMYAEGDYTYTGYSYSSLTYAGTPPPNLIDFVGAASYTITSTVSGSGQCPQSNNFLSGFTQTNDDTDPTHRIVTVTAAGSTYNCFDPYRLLGTPMPSAYAPGTWFSAVWTLVSDTHVTVDIPITGYGVTGEHWDMSLSSQIDVGSIAATMISDFFTVDPTPFGVFWPGSPLGVHYDDYAPPFGWGGDTTGLTPATYTGVASTTIGLGFTPTVPASFFGALSGWDISRNVGTDTATIVLFRGQGRNASGLPQAYFTGRLRYNPGAASGQWKFRVEFVNSGWMWPDPSTGEIRVETPFPTSTPFPVATISNNPVQCDYFFTVIGKTAAQWLADNAATLTHGWGDYNA